MADRSASVALTLKAGQFKTEATIVEQKVRGVDRAVDELDRDLDKIPPDAAKAAAALKLLSADAGKVGDQFRSIGDKSTSLNLLDARIRNTRGEVRRLAEEFEKTGDEGIFKQLGKSSGDLKILTDLRKTLTKEMQGGAKDGILSGLVGGFQSLPGSTLMKIAIPLGAALAIPLVASIGGATIAAGGAGIAGLGVLGAVLGDPERFKTAWSSVVANLKKQLVDASAPFIGPTMDALRTVGPIVQSWHLDTIFANAAKFVEPLVHGLGGAGTGIMKGVADLVKDGGPAVEELQDSFVRLGEAGGNALSSIASGAEGGATALHDLVTVVSLTIEGIGKLIQGAENAYQFMHDHPWMTAAYTGGLSLAIAYVGELDDVSSRLGTTELGLRREAEAAGHAFSQQGEDITALMQKLNAANVTADTFAGTMVNKIFSATMGLDQATLSWNQSLTQLSATIKENGRSLDIHKEKGQANISAIYAAVNANMQLYQSMLQAGATSEQAADAYNANTAALEAQLRKAGLAQSAIDGLIGKYRGIPNRVDTTIAMRGLEAAINDLNDVLRLINHLPSRRDIWVVTHYGTVGGKEGPDKYAHGGIRRAAAGLIMPPTDPGIVLASEPQTGGEALIPLRGISRARAMDLMQTAGAGYGLDVVPRWRGAPMAGRSVGGTDLRPLVTELRGLRDDNSKLRAALSGMAVVMDGQRVGEVQGRQADRFRRGG